MYTYDIRQFGKHYKRVEGYSNLVRELLSINITRQMIPKLTKGKIVNGVIVERVINTPKKEKKILLITDTRTRVFENVEEASRCTGESVKHIKESINSGFPCDYTGYCFDYLKE